MEEPDDDASPVNFLEALLELCDTIGVHASFCLLHNWHDAPHAHLGPDAFLETLEAESDLVTAVFIDVDEIDVEDDSMSEMMDVIGFPWPDLDLAPPHQREGAMQIEQGLRALIREKKGENENWVRIEAVYDPGSALLRGATVMADWSADLHLAVLEWLHDHRDELIALELVDASEDSPATRH